MKPTDKHKYMARFFDALAHPRRQMIIQVLQETGRRGLPFNRLQSRTGLTPATLAFHLRKMDDGQILNRKIKGPETWLSLDPTPFLTMETSMVATR
jgi:DNA-binding transcriptional ArsR family regulator